MIRKVINDKITKHQQSINKINEQRRWWLYASSLVFILLIFLIFGWAWLEELHRPDVWWTLFGLVIIVSINWWYWTMRVIKKFMDQQKLSLDIIGDLIVDIKEIKDDVKKLGK